MQKKDFNKTFGLLSAFGIIFVVAGHVGFGIFDVAGLFPYYSFHVPLFVFVSGYFYKDEAEKEIFKTIKKKAKKLLLPYFLWNIFYGIFVSLLRNIGLYFGEPISLKTLFFDPIVGGGHQFGLNFAAWFVPVLFLIEVIHLFLRFFTKWIGNFREWLLPLATLVLGIITVKLAIGGHVWGYYKFPGRILFLLPAYEFGVLYRKKLEKIDKIPTGLYMLILFIIQYTIVLSGYGTAYSAVWCTGFAGGPLLPYITTFTGIAFWLRIAGELSKKLSSKSILFDISNHTYSIMMHHISGFLLLNTIFFLLAQKGVLHGFDKMAYMQDYVYTYLPAGAEAGKWLYLLFGIGVPIGIEKLTDLFRT